MDDFDYKHKYPISRIRHHADPNVYLPHAQLKIDLNGYPPPIESVDWSRMFANGQPPQMLDIGCALGKFLFRYGHAVPHKNILGMEVRQHAAEWVCEVIEGEKFPNIAALWYSVVNGLDFIEEGSIEKVFYFFPDPWFKKRHHKRRAFSAQFLDAIARVLAPEGILYLMTDVPEVDAYQQEVLREHGLFAVEHVAEADWDIPVTTNQEDWSRLKNIPYERYRCRKKNGL